MDAFTSSEIKFSAKIDSKGRITVPSEIRNRLGLENGERISLSLNSGKIIKRKFSSEKEALKFLNEIAEVESFSFDGKVLEVVLSE